MGPMGSLLAFWTVLALLSSQFGVLGLEADGWRVFKRLTYLKRCPDAYNEVFHGKKNAGENHKSLQAPDGSEIISVDVGHGEKNTVAVYQTKGVDPKSLTQAIIVIHGKNRDGDRYWDTFNKVVKRAKDDFIEGSAGDIMVAAPQFFSTKYNSGQYSENQLAWDDVNAWESGDKANHPEGTKLTSIDALDALVNDFSDRQKHPKIQNITVVGHGGGGQLAQRYAMVGMSPPSGVHVRYVHGDPSTCAYWTKDRVMLEGEKLPTPVKCKLYNDWRYGFNNFPGTSDGVTDPREFFKRYVTRDVVSIIGLQDTATTNGDQHCMARIQGGKMRRNRNLIWYRYVNTLARTNETLEGFPGKFENLPDWSDISHGRTNMRLGIVRDASHDAEKVFEGKIGQSALFNDQDIEEGWRPRLAA